MTERDCIELGHRCEAKQNRTSSCLQKRSRCLVRVCRRQQDTPHRAQRLPKRTGTGSNSHKHVTGIETRHLVLYSREFLITATLNHV